MADLLVNLRIRAFESVTEIGRKVRGELDKIGKLAKDTQEKLRGTADLKLAAEAVGELGGKLRGAGAAIRDPLIAGAESFDDLEDSLVRVGARSGSSTEQIHEMVEVAARLGRETSQNAEHVAAGFSSLASSGLGAKDALLAIEPTLKLATAAEIDMGQAGQLSGTLLKRFGLDAKQLPDVLDTVAMAAQLSHTSIGDMAQAMASAAPNAKRMGISIKETAGLATALAGAGIKGEQAGQVLNSVMRKLVAPRKLGKQGLELLGVSTIDKTTGKLKPLPLILTEIAKATDKMGAGKRERFMTGIFGPEAAASVGTLIASMKGGELAALTEKLAASGGKLDEVFKLSEATMDTEHLTNAVDGLGKAVGESLAGPLGDAKELLAGMINGISRWITKHPILTRVLVYTALAVSVLLTGLGLLLGLMAGALLTAITVLATGPLLGLIGGFSGLASVVGGALIAPFTGFVSLVVAGTTGLWAMVAPALALAAPFIALAAAIGAVGLAVYQLHKHWDELNAAEGFSGLWDMFKQQGAIGTGLGLLGLNDVSQGNETFNEKTGKWETMEAPRAQANGANIGGTLHVKIDSEGRPRVASVKENGGLSLEVDAGMSTAGM